MRKLQIIVIVFLILFSISTFPSMPAKACNMYTYTASISPTLTDVGLTGVSYTITFTDTASSDMGSGTVTIPTGYTTVSLTSVTASNGDSWSGSVSSSAISFIASQGDDEISNGQTVTVVFSATNPSSAGSYTWTTAAYSDTSECGTRFTISGSQPSVTVNAGTAIHLMVSSGTTQTAGVAFSVTVTAEDAYGNVARGYTGTVHFTSSDSGAGVVLPSNYKFIAGDDGSYTFTKGVTLVTATTTGSITATDTSDSSITGSQTGITVKAASASKLVFVGVPSSLGAGVTSGAITVQLQDAYGNSVNAGTRGVTVTLSPSGVWYSNSGGTALISNNRVTISHGSSSSSSFYFMSTVAGTDSLGASATGYTSASASLIVDPGSATHFVVSGFPNPTTAGVAHSVTVTAYDAYGNLATGYLGTVKITSSDNQAVLPANDGLTDGVGTFIVTLETAGTQTITATDTVTISITGSQTGITVTPAGLASIVVSPSSAMVTAGGSQAFTAEGFDAYGNNLGDYTASVTWSIDSGAGGIWTANSVSAIYAGTWTVKATDGLISGTASLTVTHASVVSIVVSPATATIMAGGSKAFTATDKDAHGNTWDVTSTVSWSISAGADGSVSTGGLATADKTGTWTVKAVDGFGNIGTASLTVTPGVATQLVVSSGLLRLLVCRLL